MTKIFAASALMLVMIVGFGWFTQVPKPDALVTKMPPMPAVVPSAQSDPLMTVALRASLSPQPMAPTPPLAMIKRSDFLALVSGDRVRLQGRSPMNNLEDYVVTIESVSDQPASQLIKGLVEGGGAFIATLGPTTLNVFLQSDKGLMRYAGADFNGLLSPLQRINLDDDIRQRPPPKVTRLESSNRRSIELEMR